MSLRPYQVKCLEEIEKRGAGRWLIQQATGSGKTMTGTSLPRQGRTLILAHREELLNQWSSYYHVDVGLEKGANVSSGEEVVIASVQSLKNRLDKFQPDAFDTIIIDEAHHASAKTYTKCLDHFTPRRVLGFTATPARADGVGLDSVFEDIIFTYDLKTAITEGYLAPLKCKRVNVGYDLSAVRTNLGDFNQGDLSKAVNIVSANKAIAEIVKKEANLPVLIFAVDVAHAHALAEEIDGAVALDATSQNRAEVLDSFKRGEIPVLINCMLFTEGTDLPNIQTVLIARPTQSEPLYVQMVGRGSRLCDGKDYGLIIDCVGNSGKHNLCSAPILIGMDINEIPSHKHEDICGDLLDELPELIKELADTPESWIKNVKIVDIFKKRYKVKTHSINFFKMPDNSLIVCLQRAWVKVSPPDLMNRSVITTNRGSKSELMPLQEAINSVYALLNERHQDQKHIWDLRIAKKWGKYPSTPKQKGMIAQLSRGKINCKYLTKLEACNILNRLFWKR